MTWVGDPHCNSRCMMHLMNHTGILWRTKPHILFINHTIQVEVYLIRKRNIVERYLIILSPFSHSLMFALNSKFTQHCLLYGHKFKSLLNIQCTDRLDIPSCAAAFLVELLELLRSATQTASMFSGERTNEGRRRFLSNTKLSSLNWL
jgi:hypothetical protein